MPESAAARFRDSACSKMRGCAPPLFDEWLMLFLPLSRLGQNFGTCRVEGRRLLRFVVAADASIYKFYYFHL